MFAEAVMTRAMVRVATALGFRGTAAGAAEGVALTFVAATALTRGKLNQ